jgi:starch synthase
MLYASGDFLLMPSLFEPCGLNQMIAFRYGSIPIVTSVGGLKDSVYEEDRCGRGIIIKESKKESFLEAISKAVKIYEDKKKKESIMSKNLECDFSIQRCAKSYYKVYKEVVFEVSS